MVFSLARLRERGKKAARAYNQTINRRGEKSFALALQGKRRFEWNAARRSHLNSIQINPLDFGATDDTRAFVGAKNLSSCGVSLPAPWLF
jgi:hypothetical protein